MVAKQSLFRTSVNLYTPLFIGQYVGQAKLIDAFQRRSDSVCSAGQCPEDPNLGVSCKKNELGSMLNVCDRFRAIYSEAVEWKDGLNLGCLRLYGQATKRTWWMPRRQEAMKDVVVCDKPR